MFIRSFLLSVSLCVLAVPQIAHASIMEADIAGLKLGMTVAEAEAVITNSHKDFRIEKFEQSFSYSDGVNNFNTPPAVERLYASRATITSPSTAENETFIVFLSGLPGKELVTAIKRTSSGAANPTTREGFIKALVSKYGEVTDLDMNTPIARWGSTRSKQNCFDIHTATVNYPAPMERARVNGVTDISKCADGLTYTFSGDPVVSFMASLIDGKRVEETDRQLQAWVETLEAEAVSRRAANAEAPKL